MYLTTKTWIFSCRHLCSLPRNRIEFYCCRNVQKCFYETSAKLDKNGIAISVPKNSPKDDIWQSKDEIKHFQKEMMRNSKFSQMVKKLIDTLEELSHMDEVRKAQNRVMITKDKLMESSEYKREILRQLSAVREEIQKNHNATTNAQRGTRQYVDLVQAEFDLLNEEKRILIAFQEADDKEHLLLNELSTSISDSYEKEKIHSNSLKLWGFVGTLVASIITFIASLIGYFYHTSKFGTMTNDFRQSVDTTVHNETNLLRKEVNSLRTDLMKILLKTRNESSAATSLASAASASAQESWGSYLNRHTRWTYSWMLPKKSTSN